MDIEQLSEFLTRAREKCSYEAPGEPGKTPLPDESTQIGPYTEGPLSYIDIYNGYHWFNGREEIAENGIAVWRRDYKGGIIEIGYDRDEVMKLFNALKAALRLFPKDRPFERGPHYVKVDVYNYYNKCKGDISAFTGKEKITFGRKQIYICKYRGGLIETPSTT